MARLPAPGVRRWLADFPDAEERATWTNKLGNLVLLDKSRNSRAGSHDFGKKKEIYATADYALTQARAVLVLLAFAVDVPQAEL